MSAPATLVGVLQRHAAERPDRPACTFLDEEGSEAATLSYRELDERARAVAGWLRRSGLKGERALLLYPPGLEFIAGFLGCLYAGTVAVPAYPPRPRRVPVTVRAIADAARPRAVLTVASHLPKLQAVLGDTFAAVLWCATDALTREDAAEWKRCTVRRQDVAFLQYTSGSTSDPKGVMVTHGNLLHNERMIRDAFEQSAHSVVVGWLPLYHDMGLIGNILQPLYSGGRTILMSPMSFLQRPVRWLEAISHYRATTSGGPDFGYELCVRKIAREQLEGLDLACWRVAFSGAEPVREETLRRFTEAFAPAGFRREAFFPCYGLAEATLFVAGHRVGVPPVTVRVDAAELGRHRAKTPSGGTTSPILVSCGRTRLAQRIVIADPQSRRPWGEDQVGEIWVTGPSVAGGYWDRPEESERTFRARLATGKGNFLRTGDLGFLHEGELYVTGRLKDLIILRGHNHYPQDIERTVELCHPALRSGCGAAFSVEVDGEERLVVAHEMERHRQAEAPAAIQAARRAIAEEHEVQVYEVVLLRAGTLPKTSSGKVRRLACRAAYLSGNLELVERSAPAAGEALAGGLAPGALPPADREQGRLEERLVQQAARLARVQPDRVPRDEPLCRLGLDSLAAAEWQQQLAVELGIALPLQLLLDAPTPRELAAEVARRLEQGQTTRRQSSLRPQGDPCGDHPMSYGQQGLWLLHLLAPESRAYHVALAGRVHGELDAAALRRSLAALVERHPALRTTFAQREELFQRVHGALAPDFLEIDASGWDERTLEQRLHAEADRPFDLGGGPLLRLAVFSRPDHESVILLVIHHIVCDLRSLQVLMEELGAFYAAWPEGTAEPAPARLRYSDFARWQRDLLASPEGERLWRYWQDQLGGELPRLDLPTDHPRSPAARASGGGRHRSLGSGSAAGARYLMQRSGATLSATLLAVFEAVLYRYSWQEEFSVGSLSSGRDLPGVERVVGYFVNPLVLRADLSGEPSFAELLERTRRTVLAALDHRDYPLALLAERLHSQREAGWSPLFQVLFVLQKGGGPGGDGVTRYALGLPGAKVTLGGLTVESLALPPRGAQFDLTLMAAETGGDLTLALHYNHDLFDPSTADRMLKHFEVVLERAVAEPERAVCDLDLLSPAEQAQLQEWSETEESLSEPAGAHELFVAQARRTPDAVALVSDSGEFHLSYAELDRRSDGLAARLRGFGVGPEARVGLLAERSPTTVLALLAIFKAGATYVPLDPAYPGERLAWMIQDAGLAMLLTSRGSGLSSWAGAPVLVLDEETARSGGEGRWPAGDRHGGAYLIYTSGSTGRPKGVVVPHGGLIAVLRSVQRAVGLTADDVLVAVTTPSFDISLSELLLPLAVGARVAFASSQVTADGERLSARLVREDATALQATPATWRLLLEAGWVPAGDFLALCTGEALTPDLAASLLATGASLWNLYGPTETTIWSTCERVQERPIGIGSPLAGNRIRLLDGRLRPVPIGVPGELWIGGAGLARGYLGRPDLTAWRFAPDPLPAPPGARLYRTGDLARWLPDGRVEYLGRSDQQVKIRGFRIEPGEIEAVLAEHPSVRQAVVAARPESSGEVRLRAYVVPAPSATPTSAELRRFLTEKLPIYMVPSAWRLLDRLPLTPSGKVDRKALAALAPESPGAEPSYSSQGPVEQVLAAIWSEVLGVDPVGRCDDFFTLGGHSLLASRVLSRIRVILAVELPVRALFEAPTIAEMAIRIEAARRSGLALALPPITSARGDGDAPLSFAQQRLWVLQQIEPDLCAYHLPTGLRLTGRLERAALDSALAAIVRRHEILRTSYVRDGEEPRQRVSPPDSPRAPLVDLTALHGARREGELRRVMVAEAHRPFDLERGTVMRVLLFRLQPEEHVLALTLHHIAADGGSAEIFMRELAELYGASTGEQSTALPDLPVQYRDFSRWQREWLRGEALTRELEHWRRQLADLDSVLEIPTDRPRPPVPTHRGARRSCKLPAELAGALARRGQATLYMVLLAAFDVLLGRYTGQTDLAVGSPFANRDRAELEPLIGFFVDTLVLRVDLSDDPTFLELLDRVRRVSLTAHDHRSLPFEILAEELCPVRDPSHHPLFQVLFNLHDPIPLPPLPGLAASLEEVEVEAAKFDLTLTAGRSGDALTIALEYPTDLFDALTVERWLAHFAALMAGIAGDPARPLSELPMLSPPERWHLLGEWARDDRAPRDELCIHELFEEWARRSPDAVAAVFESCWITYAELNGRADRLAARLQELGVAAESRVGLYVEPSLEMVIGLLGILKAGGAYVPLSAQFPAERLRLILKDAGAEVLVTERHRADGLPDYRGRTVGLGEEGELGVRGRQPVPRRLSMPGNAAYLIYTSGSTGRPKGVVIEHRQIVEYVRGVRERLPFEPGMSLMLIQPIAVDFSNTVFFGALCSGGCLHILSAEQTTDAGSLADYFSRHCIDALKITPAHLAALHVAGDAARQMPRRWLLFGGEPSRSEWVDRLRELAPGCEIFNHYGPTETTVGVCTHHVSSRPPQTPWVPMGRPLPNARCYVLDGDFHPVPVGVAGHLFVGGPYVARGYLHRPDLTAGAFLPDPFAAGLGGRLYRTGDRVRRLRDGVLQFLGRLDHQLKVRGFRVEPGEVESFLARHPGVREVLARPWRDSSGMLRLVAYVVTAPGCHLEPEELHAFLRAQVPEFMIPAAFVHLDSLPRQAHGKVDLRALPEPAFGGSARDFAAPRNRAEEKLAVIWAEVLSVERVGVHDNFFELGGDSILSIQIVSRANRLGLELSAKQIFEHQTIAELAAAAGLAPAVEAEQGPVAGAVPLTPIQCWFFEQDLADPSHYNQSVLLEVDPRIEPGHLARALAILVDHHDALRLRFHRRWESWHQEGTAVEAGSRFGVVDLSELPERQHLAMSSEAAALQASLNLTRGPLIRAALFVAAPGRPERLLITVHHLAVDGVSWRILLEDLTGICERLARGEPVSLPRKTTSFKSWSKMLARHAKSRALETDLSYWLAEQREAAPVPVDLPGGPDLAGSSRAIHVSLSPAETSVLVRDFPAVWRAQTAEALLAALGWCWREWTGQELLWVDLEEHGREELCEGMDLSRTVGWFTAIYPLRIATNASDPAGILRAVQQERDRLRGRGLSYGLGRFLAPDPAVREKLRRHRAGIRFNYHGRLDRVLPASAPFRLASESAGPTRSPRGRRSHVFDLIAYVVDGCFRLEWHYNANLHRAATVERLAQGFLDAVRSMLRPCSPLLAGNAVPSHLPVLPSPEDLEGALKEFEVEAE